MPRVAIPVSTVPLTGVADPTPPTAGDATNDHYIAGNDGRIILRAKNTGGATQSITFRTNYQVQGITLQNSIVSVTPGWAAWFGTFPPGVFDSTGGALFIDVAESTWEFIALKVPLT